MISECWRKVKERTEAIEVTTDLEKCQKYVGEGKDEDLIKREMKKREKEKGLHWLEWIE